jgi:hypothetical protein
MKMTSQFCVTMAAVQLFATALQAQNAKRLVPVQATAGDIVDTRSTGAYSSECKIELKFTGDAATDALSVRHVHVKKAIDELDRDLAREDAADSFLHSSSGDRNGVLKTELRLRNPSRNAERIKLLEGDVELFSPTTANGGILVLKDILKHPADPVQNAALKKYGIELVYFTKETYEAKKKQLQEQQKNAAGGIDEAFGELFKGMFSGMMSSDKKNSVKLYVKDPQKRVVDVEFQDAGGKALKRGSSWSSGDMREVDFNAAPPEDTQLMVHLATPETIQTFPFSLQNIPLP